MDSPSPTTPFTVITWNLQGSEGVDVAGVAETISGVAPDIVVVQEIQRGQARRLSNALGMPAMRWAFKSLSWSTWPEGLAVFTPHRLASTDSFILQRAWFWNWRRRIGLAAEVARGDERFGVINVHLSPHGAGERRRREAHLVVERARRVDRLPTIAGDFNDLPGGPGYAVFTGSGWADAWLIDKLEDIDGPTNWTPGERHGRAPDQRLDFVFAPTGWTIDDARVLADNDRPRGERSEPTPRDRAFVSTAESAEQANRELDAASGEIHPLRTLDWFADRSDHVPLMATLRPPETPTTKR